MGVSGGAPASHGIHFLLERGCMCIWYRFLLEESSELPYFCFSRSLRVFVFVFFSFFNGGCHGAVWYFA